MKKTISFRLLIAILILSMVPIFNLGIGEAYAAASWGIVGSPQFTLGSAYSKIVLDSNDTPYVVYMDDAYETRVTVKKYNGTDWETVGSPGFSPGWATFPSLAIDRSGTPYVAFVDEEEDGKATVMRFNGTGWELVGNRGFSAGYTAYTSIAIDNNGTPFVVYNDQASENQSATVMKYNGTEWETVGNAGITAGGAEYTSIVLDRTGIPYIAFRDGAEGVNYKATVLKFNGSSWEYVGAPGFSSGKATEISMALDAGGKPYVAFSELNYDYRLTVMKYNGTEWVGVGDPGFSKQIYNYYYTSIGFDASEEPYVLYTEARENGSYPIVVKYNGTNWQEVGAGLTVDGGYGTSMAINSKGEPYVTFIDGWGKTSVVRYGAIPTSTPTSTEMATRSKVSVIVDGKAVSFDAYNIKGNNYFKLRDIAIAINNSTKNFEVTWDQTAKAINLIEGRAYSPVGGELSISVGIPEIEARLSTATVLLNGQEMSIVAYNINGNNYFKLRDLGKSINFGISWDGVTQTIGIDTSSHYDE